MTAIALRSRLLILTILSALLVSCGGSDSETNAGPSPATGRFFPANTAVPVTGPAVAGAERFDEILMAVLRKHDVPGATLAIAKGGRLILARGYGYADFEARQQMQPDAMFRIGSISKVLTSMAILHLKEQGLLDLDAKVLDVLTEFQPASGDDARLRDIHIRNLLQHSGGWDRFATPDPSGNEIARALGVPLPPTTADTIRYMLKRRLDFAPGSRVQYSNFGYCLLGQVIEKITREPYEVYVRNNVLLPMDVNAMSIGRSRLSERGPYEVQYYQYANAPLQDSEFPGEGKMFAPDAHHLARCPASGSWIGSAVDLTRVMTAIDGSRKPAFLTAETMAEYLADPHLPPIVANEWWGLGIAVGPTPEAWSHGGLVDGACSLLQRTSQYTWAVITNSWSPDPAAFGEEIHAAVTAALAAGLEGSAADLYAEFPSPNLPPRYPN